MKNGVKTFRLYEASEDLWIRMLGMITCVFGVYYLLIAYFNVQVLYHAKVWSHLFGILFMALLWALAYTDAKIFPTILMEVGAGLWALFTLKRKFVKV